MARAQTSKPSNDFRELPGAATAAVITRRAAAFSVSPDAIIVVDGSGKITDFNPSAERTFGHNRRDVIGKDLAKLITSKKNKKANNQDLAQWLKTDKDKTAERRIESLVARRDGEDFPAELFIVRVPGKKPPVIIVTVRDVTNRIRATEALQSSEQHWLTMLENSSEGIALLSLEGKLLFVSASAAAILGYTPEEMAAVKDISSYTHPDDQAMVNRRFSRVIKPGARSSATYRARAKDGSYRWVEVIAKNAVNNPSVGGVIVNFRDVTNEKNAREMLADSQATLSAVTRAAPVALWMTNEKLEMVFVNQAWCDWTGHPFEDHIGRVWTRFLADEGSRQKAAKLRQAVRRMRDYHDEFLMKDKEGQKRWLDVTGRPFFSADSKFAGYVGSASDVTERRADQQRLRESQERLELAEQASNIGIFEWTVNSSRFIWSPGQALLHGMKPESFSGKAEDWRRLILEEDIPQLTQEMQAAVESHSGFETEWRIRRPDGQIRDIYAKGQLYFDSTGKPTRMLGINMDITDRKSAERQKDEFIAVASHELRTPVTSMKTYVALLERKFKRSGDEAAAEAISAIDSQLDRLNMLVGDLLDLGRIESGHLALNAQKFNYGELIGEILRSIRLTTKRHTFSQTGAKQLVINSDRNRLGQVLTNLLENAVKYSPKPGAIKVSVRQAHGQLITCVSDQGLGIPKEYQVRLFKRFSRAGDERTRDFPGLGLGLYISAQIIETMNGKIWVKSKIDDGSKFYFSLPLASLKQNT